MRDSSIHVLLIDDDIVYTKIVTEYLKNFPDEKFVVTSEYTGPSGIQKLQNDPSVDIVLLDYFLGSMNGLDVAKEIRTAKLETPIVFVSWNKDFNLAVEAMKLNVEDYLIKSEIATSILPSTIIAALNRTELKRKITISQKNKFAAEQRAQAIKELIVTVCHEINNPLAAIKLSSEIISRGSITPEERSIVNTLGINIKKIERETIKLKDINSVPRS